METLQQQRRFKTVILLVTFLIPMLFFNSCENPFAPHQVEDDGIFSQPPKAIADTDFVPRTSR